MLKQTLRLIFLCAQEAECGGVGGQMGEQGGSESYY